jgi:sarcosine oxidase subunit beta
MNGTKMTLDRAGATDKCNSRAVPTWRLRRRPGPGVAIGTSGNQFKNAPVIGQLISRLIKDWVTGGSHDDRPVQCTLPRTGLRIGLNHYSPIADPNPESSGTVLG